MGLRKGSDKPSQDVATKRLVGQGVYRIDVQDHEAGYFRHPAPYSFLSGVKHILILSVLLWWLPTFGQMIAGYIGGRRTGAAWKAVLAAILPLAIIFAFGYALDHGYLGIGTETVAGLPASILNSISNAIPALTPYADFTLEYLSAFVGAMRTAFSLGTNGYLVTIIFAYVGGLMAEQARREATYGRRSGVGITIAQPIENTERQGERMKFRRKTPVGYANMSKISGAYIASENPVEKQSARAHQMKKEAVALPKETEVRALKQEPRRARKQDDEVRVQRFVEKALRRYETGHR